MSVALRKPPLALATFAEISAAEETRQCCSLLHARTHVHQSQPPPRRRAYSVTSTFVSVS